MREAFGGLVATYQPEGSVGIGQLDVRASVPPFAGAARGYFNDEDLRSFAEAISAYPLQGGAHPELTSGLDNRETVGLRVSQVTGRGQLAVAVHLSVTEPDRHSPVSGVISDVRMVLLTSYQALHDFAAELLSAVDAQGGIARLPIDEFS